MKARDTNVKYMLNIVPNWEQMIQMANDGNSYIFFDHIENDYKFMVRLGGMSLVAYIGIRKDLLDKYETSYPHYNSDTLNDISCHGGFTFNGEFMNNDRDDTIQDYYYYGWDYGHYGDALLHRFSSGIHPAKDDHKWLVPEVVQEGFEVLEQFKRKYKR